MTQELKSDCPPDTRIHANKTNETMRLQTFDMRSLDGPNSWLDESEIPALGKGKS